MRRISPVTIFLLIGTFLAGFLSHLLYQRWTDHPKVRQWHPVTFSRLTPVAKTATELPLVEAAEVE